MDLPRESFASPSLVTKDRKTTCSAESSDVASPRLGRNVFATLSVAALVLAFILASCHISERIPDAVVGEQRRLSEAEKGRFMRVLFIITSSSLSYGKGGDRLKDIFVPVLVDGVESLLEDENFDEADGLPPMSYHVDVYLILSYNLTDEQQGYIRNALPDQVGLQIWSDATPMDYQCETSFDEVKEGTTCKSPKLGESATSRKLETVPYQKARILNGRSQLARQHRLVIKDKFPYYDLFLAFEDDMRVTRSHVELHLSTMRNVRNMELSPSTPSQAQFWDPPTKSQAMMLRPGFIRVEAYQEELRRDNARVLPNPHRNITATNHEVVTNSVAESIPVDWNTVTDSDNKTIRHISGSTTQSIIDAKSCCHSSRVGKPGKRAPDGGDLMVWEAATQAMSVREFSSPALSWMALLPGPKKPIESYWAGSYTGTMQGKAEKNHRPRSTTPQHLAQPAGWIMTRDEIMEMHTSICGHAFLPPFGPPMFLRDGLYRHNVEFWSGGIQQWCYCGVQRILSLDPKRFSRHLIYHSANNKQYAIARERQLLVENFYGQLNSVKKAAMIEKSNHVKQQNR